MTRVTNRSVQRSGRLGRLLAIIALVVAPSTALAQLDAPHWSSTSITINCTDPCHVGHHAQGGSLTPEDENTALCQSCHKAGGLAHNLPIDTLELAVLGVSGSFHGIGVSTTQTAAGALAPQNQAMLLRLQDGKMTCSVCHNQHNVNAGGRPRISDVSRVTALGSTADITASGTFTGPDGLWYLVEITSAGDETSAGYRYSRDNGLSWTSGFTASASPTELPDPPTGPFGVFVAFPAGTYEVGERYEFSASYPFLRGDPDTELSAQLCGDCHRDWVMDTGAGGTNTYDGTARSHPVNVTIPSNEFFHNPPLDASGVAQGGGGDGNTSNDYKLGSGGQIHCLSCHGVHWADSNSATEDAP